MSAREPSIGNLPKVSKDITCAVGNTPMVRLNRIPKDISAEIVVKLESMEPCKSIKDRCALGILNEAEQRSEINPRQTTLVEATSGNTGISLAMFAAAKGYKLIITMPDNMPVQARAILMAFGAQIVLTPTENGMRGAITKAQNIVQELEVQGKHGYLVQQFQNPDNPKIHRDTTAPEMWKQTDGRMDAFVCGVGTGGTLTGCAQYLKAVNPNIKIIAVEPMESAVLSGEPSGYHKIQGIGAGFIPKNCNLSLVDEIIQVSSNDALEMARRLAKEEGLFSGISSGATVKAALQIASRPEYSGKRIVALQGSFGERYLTTALWEDILDECKEMQTSEVETSAPAPEPPVALGTTAPFSITDPQSPGFSNYLRPPGVQPSPYDADNERLVTKLLEKIKDTDNGEDVSTELRNEIDGMISDLISKGNSTDNLAAPSIFDNYNVAYVSSGASQRGNPAGGRYRGALGRKLFQTTNLFQHILKPNLVVNMVQFKIFGLLPGCTTLKGTFQQQGDKNTVRALFNPPRLTFGKSGRFTLELGPSSSVVLSTPYLDKRVRIGKGGRGSLFVFTRTDASQMEAAEVWKTYTETKPVGGKLVGGVLAACGFFVCFASKLKNIWGFVLLVAGAFFFLSKGGIIEEKQIES